MGRQIVFLLIKFTEEEYNAVKDFSYGNTKIVRNTLTAIGVVTGAENEAISKPAKNTGQSGRNGNNAVS